MNIKPYGSDAGTGIARPGISLPADALILLPVRNTVLFPGAMLPLSLGRRRSIAAAQEAARSDRPIGIIQQRDAVVDDPGDADLYEIGTVASVLRYVTAPDSSHHAICQGLQRFRVKEFLPGFPFFVARVEYLADDETQTAAIEARAHNLKRELVAALELLPQASPEVGATIEAMTSGAAVADAIASLVDLKSAEKQEILEIFNVQARLDKVAAQLAHRVAVLRLSQDIEKQTKSAMDKRQREFILREQMKTIQNELGESDAQATELDDLAKAIDDANMPEEAAEQAKRELKRLARMSDSSSEYTMVRTYIDWLTALPWSVISEERIDIKQARSVLEEDHYGLEKIKKRILEHLAVRKLNPTGKSPILCFVGPPGVGKTSLGKSIARATGREFVRVALGGVHDESEIRGHRRTYVGALPGNILQALRKAKTRNPVFMLDEMDKLGVGFHGDPSAALLEVLDPEQNNSFRDTYLGVPFDLSKVMFIATANVLDTIPGPLRDRMEVIELAGYTEQEKIEIANRYLIKRQLDASGLTEQQCHFDGEALATLVGSYTREAGVRNLEREIGRVLRHVAMDVAEGVAISPVIGVKDLQPILGAARFENEQAMRISVPGVSTGLAWTPVGGDILYIEAARTPGNGHLILTGQLGDVMKESAQAALSLVKSRAALLGLGELPFEKSDIHVHVPAGAIPKDGPSAGVAMFTALVSLLSGETVRPEIAMTGEISLRGLVLPVGGIKEKVIAAARAGITTVMLPARNRKDWDDIPKAARDKLHFVWLENVDDVVAHAFVREQRGAA